MSSQIVASARSLVIRARRSIGVVGVLSALMVAACSPAQTQGQISATAAASAGSVSVAGSTVTVSVAPAATTVDIGGAPLTF